MSDFLLMLQFFTRIPIKKNLPCEPINFKKGVFFLPLIGFFIGGIQYIIYSLLGARMPETILAAILVSLPIIITGGLHIDGLGDTCDGFFSFKGDKNRIIEIMKDSHAGTYSICAIACNILLQYVAIEYILETGNANVLFLIIMYSKFFVLFTAMWGKPAKKNGSGNIFIGNISFTILMLSVLYGIIISMLIIPISSIVGLLISGSIVSILFYMLCLSKIHGITGDTLGATQEIATIVMLLMYCYMI